MGFAVAVIIFINSIKRNIMKTKVKFAPPSCEVIEVHGEGVVCTSVPVGVAVTAFDDLTETDKSGDWSN